MNDNRILSFQVDRKDEIDHIVSMKVYGIENGLDSYIEQAETKFGCLLGDYGFTNKDVDEVNKLYHLFDLEVDKYTKGF